MIRNFSHTDWDGITSSILTCKFFQMRGEKFTTEYCSYNSVDEKVLGYINSYEYNKKDIIVITDISVSLNTAKILDNLPNIKIMIDHHDTAIKNLSGEDGKLLFDWMTIVEGDSASYLTYKYFYNECNDREKETMVFYRSLVYYTDLWDTKSRSCEEFIKYYPVIQDMNDLLGVYGLANFKARFMMNPLTVLTNEEQIKVDMIRNIKSKVVKSTNVFKMSWEFMGKKVIYGVAFAENYRSELADYVFTVDGDMLMIIMLGLNSCSGSLRRNSKHKLCEELDLTLVAQQFNVNGGGHPFAAGFGFDINNYKEIIDKALQGGFSL